MATKALMSPPPKLPLTAELSALAESTPNPQVLASTATQQVFNITNGSAIAESASMTIANETDPQPSLAITLPNAATLTRGPYEAENKRIIIHEHRPPPPYSFKIGLGLTLGDLINDKPFAPYISPTESNAALATAQALEKAKDTDDAQKKKDKRNAAARKSRQLAAKRAPAPKKAPTPMKPALKNAPAAPKPKVVRKRAIVVKPKEVATEKVVPAKKGRNEVGGKESKKDGGMSGGSGEMGGTKKRTAESESEGGPRKKAK